MVSNNKVEQVVLHTIFILLCIIAAAPFLLLISSSITEESTLLQYGYSFFPKKVSFYAYEYLFVSNAENIFRAYGITFLVTIVGTVSTMVITDKNFIAIFKLFDITEAKASIVPLKISL